MRVAVDVLGTLKGRRARDVFTLVQALYYAGHRITVWSSEFSLAKHFAEALQERGIGAIEFESKSAKYEHDPSNYFDVAIEDDRSQEYLAAKKFVWVDEIPEDYERIMKLARSLSEAPPL